MRKIVIMFNKTGISINLHTICKIIFAILQINETDAQITFYK